MKQMMFNKKTLAFLTAGVTVAAGTAAIASTVLGPVRIVGSDTMLIMNQRLAEAFGKSGAAVNVTGGGSSIGIKAFTNGTCDIAASSRAMRKSEVDKARSRGAVATATPVALDGLAIVVNAKNPVSTITMDDLRRIYIGQVTNWSQIGGPNESIVTISRNSNSGTYGFFQEKVLKMQNWGSGVRFLGSTADEVREVRNTAGGIAYGGVAYFKGASGVKILTVSAAKGGTAYGPTEDNVRSRKYPIWRFLYYYTNGAPRGDAKAFIDFALSAQGQKIIEQVGYYSVK